MTGANRLRCRPNAGIHMGRGVSLRDRRAAPTSIRAAGKNAGGPCAHLRMRAGPCAARVPRGPRGGVSQRCTRCQRLPLRDGARRRQFPGCRRRWVHRLCRWSAGPCPTPKPPAPNLQTSRRSDVQTFGPSDLRPSTFDPPSSTVALPTFTRSHVHTFTRSHVHTFARSHVHTRSSLISVHARYAGSCSRSTSNSSSTRQCHRS